MFDNLKNLASLPGLMSKAREMQEKMKLLQEELGQRQFSAESGAVSVVVNGRLQVLRVRLDPTRVEFSEAARLENDIVQAIAAAQADAAQTIAAEMSRMANELGLPPGMLPG